MHTIRSYSIQDKPALLNLLRLNTPQYFETSEEADFIEYLEKHLEQYYVIDSNSELVGCGGINYFPDEKLARLSWDMIHPAYQGKGIGKALTQFRISLLQNDSTIDTIQVRTTQLVYPFYQKMGFELLKTEQDFWAPGFDLYDMRMTLKP